MPLTKTYCKGAGLVVRHNNDLDLSSNSSNWANNCAGSNLGATPAQDLGWSYPATSGWSASSLDPQIRALYPSSQLPSFRDHSTVIKRATDTFSQKHTLRAENPWFSSSGGAKPFYGRSESYTANSIVKRQDQCFRFSVYKPVGETFDTLESAIIMQWHGGNGSPPISFHESQSGELSLFIHNGSGTQNQVNIFIGAFTKGVWHEFICFVTFSQSKTVGKILLFKDGKIVRTRVRSGSLGSYTYATGKTIKVTGTTQGMTTLNTNLQGDLPLESPEGTSWLLFYKGITLQSTQTISSIYPKWGFYKSSWDDYYNSEAVIKSNLTAGFSLINALLKNPSDPDEANYIPPALRVSDLYNSLSFGYVGSGETFEDLYLLLSDGVAMDADDRALIASEPQLSWFTLNATAPPVTEYTLTVTATTGGTVSSAGGLFESSDPVSLTATSDGGFYFLDWINIVTGTTVSVLPTYAFNMPASNLSLRARFQQISVPPEPGSSQRFFCKKPAIIV